MDLSLHNADGVRGLDEKQECLSYRCWAEQILITLERGSKPSGTKYTTVRKRWEWKISCEQADVGVVRKLIIVFSEFLYCRIN